MKRYFTELGLSFAAYAILLVVSLVVLDHGVKSNALGIIISLSPMLAFSAVCWVILRQIKRLDELQRKIQIEAIGISMLGTAFLTFAYGFLENVGFPTLSMFVVWPLMAVLWVLALVITQWRYK